MSLNIASKVNVMGAIGKSIGYMVWAANGVLQLANKGVRKSYDLLANNKKYHVTVLMEGAIIQEVKAVSASEIMKFLVGMNHFDAYEIIIKYR